MEPVVRVTLRIHVSKGTDNNHLRIFYPKIVECPGNMQRANKNEVAIESGAISEEK